MAGQVEGHAQPFDVHQIGQTGQSHRWGSFRQLGYPLLFREYVARISRHSPYLPTTSPCFRCLAFLPGVLAGARSPASSVLSRHCDFLPAFPPHFVSFAWRYRGSTPLSFARRGGVLPRRAWSWSPGISGRDFFRGDNRISQVPGEPRLSICHVLRLRQDRWSQTVQDRGMAPGKGTPKAPARNRLSKLDGMAFGLAVYASQRRLPGRHARLASRCGSGSPGRAFHPQGSAERFPECYPYIFPPFPSLPGANLFSVPSALEVVGVCERCRPRSEQKRRGTVLRFSWAGTLPPDEPKIV